MKNRENHQWTLQNKCSRAFAFVQHHQVHAPDFRGQRGVWRRRRGEYPLELRATLVKSVITEHHLARGHSRLYPEILYLTEQDFALLDYFWKFDDDDDHLFLPEMLIESRVDVGELGVEVHLPRHGVLVHAHICSRELRPV